MANKHRFTASNGVVIDAEQFESYDAILVGLGYSKLTLPGAYAAALREFFQAENAERRGRQPAPEPEWYNAKPGEIWVLTIGGREQIAWAIEGGQWFKVPAAGFTYERRHAHIKDGYRIWPTEGGSND